MRAGMSKKEVISTGAFYTPKIWVDELHRMLSYHLGEDWKEKFVVWDAGWYQIRTGIVNTPAGKSIIQKGRTANKKLIDLYKEKYTPLLLSCGYFPDIFSNLKLEGNDNEHTN